MSNFGDDRITILSLRSSQRNAGLIERYHEHPTVQRQNVGEHTWQVMRIWLVIFGRKDDATDGRILQYIMFHDAGELGTGDIPFPVKKNNPPLKAIMDELEHQSLMRQKIVLPDMSEHELKEVKICDLIEMAEFGREELRRGCAYGRPILDGCTEAIRGLLEVVQWTIHEKLSIKEFYRDNVGVQL